MLNPATQKKKRSDFSTKQEEGMALIITLMMGLMLLAGSSGLLARMTMSRKLGASESYQQMAETAALNGFNRILATLNNDNDEKYRGYYFSLDNKEGEPDVQGDESLDWDTANNDPRPKPLEELCTDTSVGLPVGWPRNELQLTSGTQRNDGKGPIQLFYRMRQYSQPEDGGQGEGTFMIEGLVRRESAGNPENYLARTLLTRSLYVQSLVAAEGDWAVMAGKYMELGDSKVTDHNNNADGAGMILLDVKDASAFDTSSECSESALKSAVDANNQEIGSKVWPVLKRGFPLTTLFEKDKLIDSVDGAARIWSFDDTPAPADPDLDPDSASFQAQCINSVVCTRLANSDEFKTPEGVEINNASKTISIKSDVLCKDQSGFECHVFIEHLKLSSTQLLIETGQRPVVLHLEKPQGDAINSNLSGQIKLTGTSKLCGTTGGSSCNGKPERLVITANAGQTGMACNASTHVLSFEGDTLPHAFIHLPRGTVRPSADSKLHGVIWAHSICAKDGSIHLVTEDSSSTVVRATDDLWKWSEEGFAGYGRMVTRGIRGTGLDTFRRW